MTWKKNPRVFAYIQIDKVKEIKELCKELDTPKEKVNKDFNEIPLSPPTKQEFIKQEVILADEKGIMIRKIKKPTIKGFSLPNQEALLRKFKTKYYTAVIHQYILKTLSYYKQKERQKYKIIRRTVSYKKDPRFTLRFKIRRVKGVKTPKTLHKSEWKYNSKQKKVQQSLANREALKTVIKHRIGKKVVNTFTPLSNFKITIKGGELQ